MKHEGIKVILRSFLKEKQCSSSDDVDGFGYDCPEYMSGESFDSFQGRANGLMFMEQGAVNLPLNELNAHLDPDLEEIASGIGRQLSQMSDEFESDHADAIYSRSSSNESISVHFREHIIRVPPKEGHVQIPVIRAGSADGSVEALWRTCDKSAKAGLHYVDNQGNLSFAEGETEKTINIEIKTDNEIKANMCFAVELYDAGGTFNTLMVYFDDSKLYPEERRTINNIFEARHISVSEVATRLKDKVTPNTFKAALQYLCSSTDSIPQELALASELVWLTIPHARLSTMTNVFCEFFSDLPELEEIISLF